MLNLPDPPESLGHCLQQAMQRWDSYHANGTWVFLARLQECFTFIQLIVVSGPVGSLNVLNVEAGVKIDLEFKQGRKKKKES